MRMNQDLLNSFSFCHVQRVVVDRLAGYTAGEIGPKFYQNVHNLLHNLLGNVDPAKLAIRTLSVI